MVPTQRGEEKPPALRGEARRRHSEGWSLGHPLAAVRLRNPLGAHNKKLNPSQQQMVRRAGGLARHCSVEAVM